MELFECILASVSLIFGFFCIKDRPEVAPSISALVKAPKFQTINEEIKFLLGIPNVIFSTFIFGVCVGLAYAFPIVMDLLLQPYNISFEHECALGVTYITGGFLARIFGVKWIKKSGKPNYDAVLKVLLTGSMVCMFFLGIIVHVFDVANLPLLYFFHLLLGAGLIGFIPFACNSFVQSTFPVQELISINTILSAGAVFGIFETHLSIADFVEAGGIFLLAGMISPCWVYIMFYYKTDYRKQKAKNINIELDFEFGKMHHFSLQDKRGFPLVSPIEKKNSLHFVSYNQLSQFSKDLISSNPHTPLLKKDEDDFETKIIRSHSNTTHDRKIKKESEGVKLEELVNMTHLHH